MDDKKHPFTSHVPYLYFQEFIFDFFYPFTLFLIKKKGAILHRLNLLPFFHCLTEAKTAPFPFPGVRLYLNGP